MIVHQTASFICPEKKNPVAAAASNLDLIFEGNKEQYLMGLDKYSFDKNATVYSK